MDREREDFARPIEPRFAACSSVTCTHSARRHWVSTTALKSPSRWPFQSPGFISSSRSLLRNLRTVIICFLVLKIAQHSLSENTQIIDHNSHSCLPFGICCCIGLPCGISCCAFPTAFAAVASFPVAPAAASAFPVASALLHQPSL